MHTYIHTYIHTYRHTDIQTYVHQHGMLQTTYDSYQPPGAFDALTYLVSIFSSNKPLARRSSSVLSGMASKYDGLPWALRSKVGIGMPYAGRNIACHEIHESIEDNNRLSDDEDAHRVIV
jgi:hypothetical protein